MKKNNFKMGRVGNSYVQHLIVFSTICVLIVVAGCPGGTKTSKVTGTVMIDEQPVEDVYIMFTPSDGGRPAAARTDKSGKYSLALTEKISGCMPGPHVVRITAEKMVPNPDFGKTNDAGVPEPAEILQQYLPAQYNSSAHKNPVMTVTVKEGANTLDFHLTTK